ncbi:MAG: diaminopimelate decarboxylase [Defluviitaleaceae bacterium]|nr:diaminopimelate decarboxylase [Defluviitaleaceae bacterium]
MSILEIGGVKATALADQFKTPLYVYDQQHIEQTLATFVDRFKSTQFSTQIIYASKAFQAIYLLNLVAEYGLGLDVVTGGELFVATQSNMPRNRIYFHGNNKSLEELDLAFKWGVQHIICDNVMELEVIGQLAQKYQQEMNIMLRLNVGIEAHTHEYIITSHIDSKFGFAWESEECRKCLDLLANNPYLKLEGIHSHIGSQIFDLTAWYASIDKLVTYLKAFNEPLVLNIGGGFGIQYTAADQPLDLGESLTSLISYVEKALAEQQVTISKLMIEPGRSLVGNAGSTLYTVGYQKQTPEKLYYFVDGGMSDNLRPSLYQAKYACDIANRMDAPKTEKVTVAGKCCESGDILIEACLLPVASQGDLLVTYATGAYGYSMSNQYNKNVTPAVVFVKDGIAHEVIRRQTFEDLLHYEVTEKKKRGFKNDV